MDPKLAGSIQTVQDLAEILYPLLQEREAQK